MKKEKDSVIWMGAGQIGLAIVRRIASGKKIIIGDKSMAHAQAAADLLNTTGFDAVAMKQTSRRGNPYFRSLPKHRSMEISDTW